ncbi:MULTISPECIES: hypothetical protein [Rhizobium/Agrobacterium group]|uniref:hypothetical protein n=1 Tax=Rhizobium/Agrobacterium group TaxID=227290 RepID=UPI0023014262|nr:MULTISPECIES: hypothetical protein [Rhizobium/Agrobacterium group]MDA5634275.1 hypothetical protein [Agrobacterium sp. ST15.16.024]MDF1891295.1 hypothetical protein [Rhizobium rhizogenes]MDO3442765.1 hypothetical protein [Agrobacterium sp. V1]
MRLSSNFLYLFVVVLFFLPGCTATGLREFELYRQAYEAQFAEADALLVDIAKAERALWKAVDSSKKNKWFVADDAAFYVEGTEPPLTHSLRGSLLAVREYNAALVALGGGENADRLTGRLRSLGLDINSAYASVKVAVRAGNQAAQVAKVLAPGLEIAAVGINQSLKIAARHQFSERVVSTSKDVEVLLVGLRNAAPSIYIMLDAGDEYLFDSRPAVERSAAKDRRRAQVGGWVLLIDQSIATLKKAVQAAAAPRALDTSIDDLSAAALELRILAEKVRAERTR